MATLFLSSSISQGATAQQPSSSTSPLSVHTLETLLSGALETLIEKILTDTLGYMSIRQMILKINYPAAQFTYNMHLNRHPNFSCTLFTGVLILTIFAILSLNNTHIVQTTFSQETSFSDPTVKTLLTGAIENLQKGNVNNTLDHLNLIDKQLSSPTLNQNTSSTQQQTIKLLIQDAKDALIAQDNNRAFIYLNLSAQHAGLEFSDNNTADTMPSSTNLTNTNATANTTIIEYTNPVFGFRMQYPSNWTAIESEYNPAANNTVVGFFAQSKTASELGNISGVSGSFVPYLDIYTFDSKNFSLGRIVNSTINNLQPPENFVVYESRTEVIGGNLRGHVLLYDTIVGDGEHFRKLQVYTIIDGNVFVITYTSQQDLFPVYLSAVHRMVESFEQT